MKLTTFNSFGRISISKRAVSKVASISILECYGVVELVTPILNRVSKHHSFRGVVVSSSEDNIITIDVYVVLKYGVAISAVSDSIRKSVKYSVEKFTGMLIDGINIHVVGVK